MAARSRRVSGESSRCRDGGLSGHDDSCHGRHQNCCRMKCGPCRSAPTRCIRFFFQAEDGIRDKLVTGVQTCALPISSSREIDLVEEVARVKMEEIPFTLPERDAMFGRLTRWQRLRRLVEDVLTGCGFSEAYTSTFVAEGDLQLPEPLSREAAALRTALIGSLVDVARHNVAVGTAEVALFEIARIYHTGGELPDERWHVAGIVDGGFADAKWAVEQLYEALKVEPEYERADELRLHPGKSARTKEGWVGELHPSLLEGTW